MNRALLATLLLSFLAACSSDDGTPATPRSDAGTGNDTGTKPDASTTDGGNPIPPEGDAGSLPGPVMGTAAGVPTFTSIGIAWSGSGGAGKTCNVRYRAAGQTGWSVGYPLWFDSRAAGGNGSAARPANEYRGSIVGLVPGTKYEVQVGLDDASATNTMTVTTWSETFPVGNTIPVTNGSSTINVTNGGTASGYVLYAPANGTATIDIANKSANCIYVNAPFVIIRGLVLKGAGEDAIVLGPKAHDVVIENNDISGWGYIGAGSNNQAAVRVKGFSYDAHGVERIIIQRNKIHNPRDASNSWDDGGHPLGPNGINFETAGGNHVIRYNEIYSDAAHYFMDGIGGADNFTFEGFPRADTDIYGNEISNVYDDAIEAEGGNRNVRIWGNFTDHTFTGIATATNSVGPMYIFRNVTNVSQRSPTNASPATIDAEDRGPFNKCGSQDATYRGGRTYLFNNTVLQPTENGYQYPRGMAGGPVDNGGPVANVFSRNNVWQTHRTAGGWPSIGEWQSSATNGSSYDYDLYNGNLVIPSGTQEKNGVKGTPTYASPVPLVGPNPAGYFLAPASNGVDKGVVLPNFTDGFSGAAPDMGAYETGAPPLVFGP